MKSLLKGIGIGLGIGIILLAALYLCLTFSGNRLSSRRNISENAGIQTEPAEPISSQETTQEENTSEPLSAETEKEPSEVLPEEPLPEPDVTLSFAGDVMFPDHYLSAYDAGGIQAIADSGMLSHMQDSDLFLLN